MASAPCRSVAPFGGGSRLNRPARQSRRPAIGTRREILVPQRREGYRWQEAEPFDTLIVLDRSRPSVAWADGASKSGYRVLAKHMPARATLIGSRPRPAHVILPNPRSRVMGGFACSTFKVAAATALMSLVQEGAIDLDRPVLQYDSSLAFSDPVAGCEITLRQLLSHTSGLDDTHQIEPQPRRCLPFVARPARAFRYSYVGFDLGVLTAAQQCGVSYESLLRTRVLSPLAMKAMHWRPGFAFATPFTPARDLMLLAGE